MMTAPLPVAELALDDPKASPIVARTFGQPRFHADGDIAALAFAADGTVWAADETGVLRHYAADGIPIQRTYLSDLQSVWRFGPGAELLVSGTDSLLVWDTAEGQLLGRIPQVSWVTALAVHPDGRTVATGHDDGKVRFWDARTQKSLGEIAAHPRAISAIDFAPAGDRLATAGEDRMVRVWDADSHKMRAELKSHTDRIPALTWRADGELLVSAGWDTSARVWRPTGGDPLLLLNSHADQVVTAAFSPDGKLLATADSEFEIHLWSNAEAGRERHVLRGHADEIRCLAFSADGLKLASAGADRVVHIWDTRDGRLLGGPNPHGKHAIAVVPGPNARLASTGGPTARLWATETGDLLPLLGDEPANSVAASTDGRWLAVGGTGIGTRLFDLTKPDAPPRLLEATKPPIGPLAFSPDGTFLAQCSPADGLTWIWDTTHDGDAKVILIESADGCTLETVAVHPNGRYVAVGGADYLGTGERDGAVCVWDLKSGEKAMSFDNGVYSIAFDPKGRFLAGAGLTDRVHVWDLTREEEVFHLEGHQERINAVAFTPDGSFLLSGGDDGTVRVWDVLSGRLMVAREFDAPVQALAVSADGQFVYTGNGNTTVHQIAWASLLND